MEARRLRDKFAVEVQGAPATASSTRVTFGSLANEWLSQQRARVEGGEMSPRTFEGYELALTPPAGRRRPTRRAPRAAVDSGACTASAAGVPETYAVGGTPWTPDCNPRRAFGSGSCRSSEKQHAPAPVTTDISHEASPQRLIEREGELSELRAACDSARSGRGCAVVVEGPAGVGKTALLDAARAYAERAGFFVLAASGVEFEHDLAFALARQLFERPPLPVRGLERAEMLSGATALARRVLLDPNPEPAPDSFHAAVHGLYRLAVELAADRPVLLVVDDAHWADPPRYAGSPTRPAGSTAVPLIALIAGRESEPGSDAALFEAIGAAAIAVVRPRPLGRAGAGDYLAAAFGADPTDAFCEECLDATGGNPFLLGELVAALRADGVTPDDDGAARVATIAPAGIARSVLARLVPLGAAAVAVAEAVAVLSTTRGWIASRRSRASRSRRRPRSSTS